MGSRISPLKQGNQKQKQKMEFKSDVPKQEVAPKGGFKVWNRRGVPQSRFLPGWAVFAGIGFATIYGMNSIGNTKNEMRKVRQEVRERRYAQLAFLMAEADVRNLKEQAELLKEEEQTVKNVPGWKVGEKVYNTEKYVTPLQFRTF